MPLVRLIDVSFSYRDSVPILTGASLQFGCGWTGVVGPNGAGKSTLLALLAAELTPELKEQEKRMREHTDAKR